MRSRGAAVVFAVVASSVHDGDAEAAIMKGYNPDARSRVCAASGT